MMGLLDLAGADDKFARLYMGGSGELSAAARCVSWRRREHAPAKAVGWRCGAGGSTDVGRHTSAPVAVGAPAPFWCDAPQACCTLRNVSGRLDGEITPYFV